MFEGSELLHLTTCNVLQKVIERLQRKLTRLHYLHNGTAYTKPDFQYHIGPASESFNFRNYRLVFATPNYRRETAARRPFTN